MAFHAGAELTNLECFQINPLIKDCNNPARAYLTGPTGGYTAGNRGERFTSARLGAGRPPRAPCSGWRVRSPSRTTIPTSSRAA